MPFIKTIFTLLLLLCGKLCMAQTIYPQLVADICTTIDTAGNPGNSIPHFLGMVNGKMVLNAWTDDYYNLYLIDKTGNIEKSNYPNIQPHKKPWYLQLSYYDTMDNELYFRPRQEADTAQLLRWNGIDAPVNILEGLPIRDAAWVLAENGRVTFSALNESGYSLWQYIPATGQCSKLADIAGHFFTYFRGDLYFVGDDGTGDELYKYDFSTHTPSKVADLCSFKRGSEISDIQVANDVLYFTAKGETDIEKLYTYDGVSDPVRTDIFEDLTNSFAYYSDNKISLFDNTLYIHVTTFEHSYVWTYNTLTRATKLIFESWEREMLTGNFSVYHNKLVIPTLATGNSIPKIYLYDIVEGKTTVMPMPEYAQRFYAYRTFVYEDVLYLSAYTDKYGGELYKYDDKIRIVPERIRLYPNPATTHTKLEISSQKKQTLYAVITDVVGRVVFRKLLGTFDAGVHKIDFPIAHIATGMYICTLYEQNRGLLWTGKLVRQ